MLPGVEIALWSLVALAAVLTVCFGVVRRQPLVAARSSEVVVTRKVKARRARVDSIPLPRFVEAGDDLEMTVISTAEPPVSRAHPPLELGPLSEIPRSRVELRFERLAAVDRPPSTHARVSVHAHGDTHCGRQREHNEDRFLIAPEHALFAIADGMGGHRGGEIASALAVDTLHHAYLRHDFQGSLDSVGPLPTDGQELALAIQMANHAVHTRAGEDRQLSEMGTTLVAARFSNREPRVYIGHVGDSRCYRIRQGQTCQLTQDHTLGSVGVVGPNQHHLVRAIGVEPSVTIDLVVDRPEPDDVYCLCSDGLTKMLEDREICRIISSAADLKTAVSSLIDLANDRGGNDNLSVILVRVSGTPPAALSARSK